MVNFQFNFLIFTPLVPLTILCRVSAVGMATSYCLDGPGIDFQFGVKFSAPILTGPRAHPTSYTVGTESLPVIKRPGRGVNYPPRLLPTLKKE